MAQNQTEYEITVWSGGTNYNTLKEDGEPEFFDFQEAQQAVQAFNEKIQEGYLGAYVTIRKFKADKPYPLAEYGVDMADCHPVESLPKYVKTTAVLDMFNQCQAENSLAEWLEANPTLATQMGWE